MQLLATSGDARSCCALLCVTGFRIQGNQRSPELSPVQLLHGTCSSSSVPQQTWPPSFSYFFLARVLLDTWAPVLTWQEHSGYAEDAEVQGSCAAGDGTTLPVGPDLQVTSTNSRSCVLLKARLPASHSQSVGQTGKLSQGRLSEAKPSKAQACAHGEITESSGIF